MKRLLAICLLLTSLLPADAAINSGAITFGSGLTLQPASGSSTYTLTLPATAGSNLQFLQTDGSGTTTFAGLPNPSASTLGGIESLAAVTSKWINTISTSGVPSAIQPAFSDISGTASSTQIPVGNVNAQTISYTLVAGDSGKLVTFNGSSLTATLPSSPPNANWNCYIENLASTSLTIARNGLTINGGTSNITLPQYGMVRLFTDNTNYFAQTPLVAGTNITLTPAVTGLTIAASGGGGTPGGSNTQVQYNNSSAFGGITNATSDGTTLTLTSPKIVTGINDTNGNSLVAYTATSSAIFGLTLTNAASGGTVALGVTAPTQATAGIAGTPLSLAASDAVAGSGTAGAVAGGAVTITSGNAKRLTSGNANGGNINLTTGTGIGTGTQGNIVIGAATIIGDTSTPNLILSNGNGVTLSYGSSSQFFAGGSASISNGGVNCFQINSTVNALRSAGILAWTNIANAGGSTWDTGFARNVAGLVEVNNGTAGTFRDLKVRQHYVDATLTGSGTTGNQTINKAAGSVRIAAAGTSVTVTDNLVTANSIILGTIATNDATAVLKNIVASAGSFVITLNAAATAETEIRWVVINQ